MKLENGACKVDADCVLTDEPIACNACNLADLYPARKATVDAREARCGGTRCTVGCPPKDTYTRAFYRAECHDHRCIAWRWHTGG